MTWLTSPLFYLAVLLFSGFALCGLALWTEYKKNKPGDFDQSAWFLLGLLCVAILSMVAFCFFVLF